MDEKVDAYLALPQFDLQDVDMEIVRSPARREILRKEALSSEAA